MLALLASAALLSAAPSPVSVPSLPRAAKVDGALKDLATAVALGKPPLSVRLAEHKGTLVLGIEAQDDAVLPGDVLTATLHFPSAGPTTTGHVFRFALDGKRASPPEEGTPAFAQELVRAVSKQRAGGLTVEAALPPRALPRFNAEGPLLLDLCVTFDDQDAVGAATTATSTCKAGAMEGGSLRLPESFRKQLGLKPPKGVSEIQAAKGGWLGFGDLRFPRWVSSDTALTAPKLRALVGPEQPVDAKTLNLPELVQLPDGRPLVSVLSGEDPYAREGECNAERELRFALYLVKGKEARRALDWPAVTCALGRLLSAVVDEEGALTLGYSNGASVNFAWSVDHFERTEIGKR